MLFKRNFEYLPQLAINKDIRYHKNGVAFYTGPILTPYFNYAGRQLAGPFLSDIRCTGCTGTCMTITHGLLLPSLKMEINGECNKQSNKQLITNKRTINYILITFFRHHQ